MKNADMPANPVKGCDNALFNLKDGLIDSNYLKQGQFSIGLTKREAFAMAAMQGLMANSHLADVLTSIDRVSDRSAQEVLIHTSVTCADDLLKELEEK